MLLVLAAENGEGKDDTKEACQVAGELEDVKKRKPCRAGGDADHGKPGSRTSASDCT